MIANILSIAAKPAPAAGAPPGASLLGLDFAALLAPASGDAPPVAPRQESADDGKDLPGDAADVWLAMLAGSIATPIAVPGDATSPTATAVAQVASTATPITPPDLLATQAQTAALPEVASTPAAGDATPQPPVATVFLGTRPAEREAQPDMAKLPADITPPRAVAPSPAVSTAQVVAGMAERPAPLVQGLTPLTRAAATPLAETPRRTGEREQAGTIRTDGTIQLPLVAAAIEPHRTMLDLRQEHWPQRMVEHIETLRDAANAADTRIRLVPDALGTVDVQLRREGETVHVAFAADRAETRALLDQAQPKLAELGEARGLRFAQSGAGQHGQASPRYAPELSVPAAPRRAASTDAAADAAADTRLA